MDTRKIILFLLLLSMMVSCASAVSITYSGGIIRVENGNANLTQVASAFPNTTLIQNMGDGVFELKKPLQAYSTGTLYINDTDCTWLKMYGDATTAPVSYLRASGNIRISDTKITSWNTTTSDVSRIITHRRPYIIAINSLGNIRIENSNCSYLGDPSAVGGGGVGTTYTNTLLVHNNTLLNNYIGVYLYASKNCTVTNNTISNSTVYGVWGKSTNGTVVSNNSISYGASGVTFEGKLSRYNYITNNNIFGNSSNIKMRVSANHNYILSNYIHNTHPHAAVDIHENASYNTVEYNTIQDLPFYGGTTPHGVFIHNAGSSNNVVRYNTISDVNGACINLLGYYAAGYSTSAVHDNVIEHNILQNTDMQGYVLKDGYSNIFRSNLLLNCDPTISLYNSTLSANVNHDNVFDNNTYTGYSNFNTYNIIGTNYIYNTTGVINVDFVNNIGSTLDIRNFDNVLFNSSSGSIELYENMSKQLITTDDVITTYPSIVIVPSFVTNHTGHIEIDVINNNTLRLQQSIPGNIIVTVQNSTASNLDIRYPNGTTANITRFIAGSATSVLPVTDTYYYLSYPMTNIMSFTPTDTTPTVLNGSITTFTANLSSSGFWEALVNGTVATNGTGTSALYTYTATSIGDKNITIRTDDDQQMWIVTITEPSALTSFIDVPAAVATVITTSAIIASAVDYWKRKRRGRAS